MDEDELKNPCKRLLFEAETCVQALLVTGDGGGGGGGGGDDDCSFSYVLQLTSIVMNMCTEINSF
jgi:hypothetical protein